ncbi:hypothetical protein Lal_00042981 [Lupinus albus]|nr:hypothetical protein Lal_00042981 [Lupinus albus]
MFGITSSSSRLLAYGIYISRVIENVGINTTNEKIIAVNPKEHLIDDSLTHKMSLYIYSGLWMCHEDYQTTIMIYDKEEDANPAEQTQASPNDEAPNMPQALSFGLAYLDAMEQRQNERVDNRMRAMKDNPIAEGSRLGERWLTWVSGKLEDAKGFSPERDLARLGASVEFLKWAGFSRLSEKRLA